MPEDDAGEAARALVADEPLVRWCAAALRDRVEPGLALFVRDAPLLAQTARAMAERFERGGRLFVFGRGRYATDAMHVAVEFTHPVLVGKRALPALDISLAPLGSVRALARRCDIVIGFDPAGDAELDDAFARARAAGALVIALPGSAASRADYALEAPGCDERRVRELVEIAAHVLYESVHVFLEHRVGRHDLGASNFLYPFLTAGSHDFAALERDVAVSIVAKVREGEQLRERLAAEEAPAIASAVVALHDVAARGNTLLCFGNGGSATDALDFALDCIGDVPPVRAISLAHEPATLTAIANDVGCEAIFARQLIAQAQPGDAAVAFSTSGGSRNVIAGLQEARRRGLVTVALLGYDGGEIVRRGLADHAIVVRSDFVPRVQEAQAAVYHTLRAGLALAYVP